MEAARSVSQGHLQLPLNLSHPGLPETPYKEKQNKTITKLKKNLKKQTDRWTDRQEGRLSVISSHLAIANNNTRSSSKTLVTYSITTVHRVAGSKLKRQSGG